MREPFPLRRLDSANVGDEDELQDGLAEDQDFVLTPTHVSQTWTEWGRTRYVCLPLHLVSSVVFRFHAPPWRLVLALVLLLGSAALWLKVLVVKSASGHLVLERRGGDDGTLMRVAEKIVERQTALLRRGLNKGSTQARS